MSRPKLPRPACPCCRAKDLPGSVGWSLGFYLGFKAGASKTGLELAKLVEDLCPDHAAQLERVLENRVTKPG